MPDMERDDELDRVLARSFGPPHADAAHAESIEPSSGFAASVMERVREEAAAKAALGPIQFPWMRAVPGICMAVLALGVCITLLVLASMGVARLATGTYYSAAVQGSAGVAAQWAEIAMRMHLGWIAVGVLIAFVPVTLLRSISGGGQRT
jgi:hypothetical protein